MQQIRREFPQGRYPLRIEDTTFHLGEYQALLDAQEDEINAFRQRREAAFAAELAHWHTTGRVTYLARTDADALVALQRLARAEGQGRGGPHDEQRVSDGIGERRADEVSAPSHATPAGVLNRAALPVPSAEPGSPGEPARIVTTPPLETFRIV